MNERDINKQREITIVQCGRRISPQEIDEIVEICHLFPKLSHYELVSTICENLSWFAPSGTPKHDACSKLLKKLEGQGLLKLPEKRKKRPPVPHSPSAIEMPERPPLMNRPLKAYQPIRLRVVERKEEITLFNEYLRRYHYLGGVNPIGCFLRYFVENRDHRLGCALFAGAAKALGARDRWIGWTDNQRLQNLGWVINNTRLLFFPWVRVKNLASHVLAQIHRQVRDDWYRRWGYVPVLAETFVAPELYQGSCYKAAGWRYIGMTTGEGLTRRGKNYTTAPKMIFAKPLMEDFRAALCRERDRKAGKP